METKVAIIGIIVEDAQKVSEVQKLLSDFSEFIIIHLRKANGRINAFIAVCAIQIVRNLWIFQLC